MRETSKARNGIPITVRQLKAIIRIAESRSKMQFNKQVTKKHVEEADRIFENSTISAASAGITSMFEIPHDLKIIITKIEDSIRKRLAIGAKISNARLIEELSIKFQNVISIEMAILNAVREMN